MLDVFPDINRDTTWEEWKHNFFDNIKTAADVEQGLRSKWTPDTLGTFYKTNLHRLANLARHRDITQIITPSNTYPYKRNNFEKLMYHANRQGEKVIKKVSQTTTNSVTGIKALAGVIPKMLFCNQRSEYHPRDMPLEPFIRKIFDYQSFRRTSRSISKLAIVYLSFLS